MKIFDVASRPLESLFCGLKNFATFVISPHFYNIFFTHLEKPQENKAKRSHGDIAYVSCWAAVPRRRVLRAKPDGSP